MLAYTYTMESRINTADRIRVGLLQASDPWTLRLLAAVARSRELEFVELYVHDIYANETRRVTTNEVEESPCLGASYLALDRR